MDGLGPHGSPSYRAAVYCHACHIDGPMKPPLLLEEVLRNGTWGGAIEDKSRTVLVFDCPSPCALRSDTLQYLEGIVDVRQGQHLAREQELQGEALSRR
jgi:hypothetical protein